MSKNQNSNADLSDSVSLILHSKSICLRLISPSNAYFSLWSSKFEIVTYNNNEPDNIVTT